LSLVEALPLFPLGGLNHGELACLDSGLFALRLVARTLHPTRRAHGEVRDAERSDGASGPHASKRACPRPLPPSVVAVVGLRTCVATVSRSSAEMPSITYARSKQRCPLYRTCGNVEHLRQTSPCSGLSSWYWMQKELGQATAPTTTALTFTAPQKC